MVYYGKAFMSLKKLNLMISNNVFLKICFILLNKTKMKK